MDMTFSMKKFILKILRLADWILVIPVWFSAWFLKSIRRLGVQNLPICRKAFLGVGVFPIRNHYYEPQFDHRSHRLPWAKERSLPGIDWNLPSQIALLSKLHYSNELENVALQQQDELEFYLENKNFQSGDAEFWYQIIRALKPTRIFEVGSGHSTLKAIRAIKENQSDNSEYQCKHVCIEPYEQPWLEKTGVTILRKLVEEVDFSVFLELQANDILFIDSSHIIRPQGDVLFEYLELLPRLNAGVIVHIHGIFSPRNYPAFWLEEKILFWNEQYLVEAFLSNNSDWKIISALNYLHHNHYSDLKNVAPFLTPGREPGSFYIQKITEPK